MDKVQPRVFLSYSHRDITTVEVIKKLLTDNQIRVQWDNGFDVGDNWTPQLIRDLKDADCVLVCWSHTSAQSRMVQDEFFASFYDDKFIGIALQDKIKYPGIADQPHHERYFEWTAANREERLNHLLKSIRDKAARRNPPVSHKQIRNFVRRVNRRPQAMAIKSTLNEAMSADHPHLIWLFAAHRYEQPGEFATRAANELLPQFLKTKGIISDANDQSYEKDLYTLKWPEGYRDTPEALDVMIRELAGKVPGDVDDNSDLAACIQATDSIAPILYLELPLDRWRPTDIDVLREFLKRVSAIRFQAAQQKYLSVFVAAKYYSEKERQVELPAQGLLARFRPRRQDIDEVFNSLAGEDESRDPLPTLGMIKPRHVDDWKDKIAEENEIPEEHENYFVKEIHKPFLDKDSEEEHYQTIADNLQKALVTVFLGKGDRQA